MRLARIVAAALAVAVLHIAPLPATAQVSPSMCQYTIASASQELDAAHDPYVILEGAEKDTFLTELAASYKLKTGNDLQLPPITRVLMLVIQNDIFFGVEFAVDGCLSPPVPLAAFVPDIPRSGRDATGTHS